MRSAGLGEPAGGTDRCSEPQVGRFDSANLGGSSPQLGQSALVVSAVVVVVVSMAQTVVTSVSTISTITSISTVSAVTSISTIAEVVASVAHAQGRAVAHVVGVGDGRGVPVAVAHARDDRRAQLVTVACEV